MNTFRNLFLALALCLMAPALAFSQVKAIGDTVGAFIDNGGVTDDTGVLMVVGYKNDVGTATAVSIDPTATGFTITATGDSDLPVSDGETAGTIVLDDTDADTFGELADRFNETDYFFARLVGATRDMATTSTNAAYTDIPADTTPWETSPVVLLHDMSVSSRVVLCVGPEFDSGIDNALFRRSEGDGPIRNQTGTVADRNKPSFAEMQSKVDRLEVFAGNTGPTVYVYSSDQAADRLIWQSPVLTADTLKTYDLDDTKAWVSDPGDRLVIHIDSASADVIGGSILGRFGSAGNWVWE